MKNIDVDEVIKRMSDFNIVLAFVAGFMIAFAIFKATTPDEVKEPEKIVIAQPKPAELALKVEPEVVPAPKEVKPKEEPKSVVESIKEAVIAIKDAANTEIRDDIQACYKLGGENPFEKPLYIFVQDSAQGSDGIYYKYSFHPAEKAHSSGWGGSSTFRKDRKIPCEQAIKERLAQ